MQFHRELELPRRACVSRRSARTARNQSERLVQCRVERSQHRIRQTRIREVRVVQQVEDIGANLKTDPFSNARVLDQREIQILESRALDDVAAQRTEAGGALIEENLRI